MTRCLNCMKEFDEQFVFCPECGWKLGTAAKEVYQLSPGVVLAKRYVIGMAIGVGGFGITYKAWDETLQKMLAVKEYYPSANGIVNRNPGKSEVIVYSGDRAVEFQNGKQRFLAEARSMAKFNTHPSIVHVFDFFEENGTAYIVMEFLDGISYKQFIASNQGKVDEKVAIEVTLAVLDALKEIHKSGIIHRDISPDNVFICQNGTIKLIDFGAARFSTGEEEKTLSIILKPGYAPPEQYRSRSRQGPWTDIYAVGAMMYRAVTGRMPDESVNRLVQDNLVSPNQLNPEIPENLSNTIMRAMALNQELRFNNVDQFRDALLNKTVVRDVHTELKRRKTFRTAIIAAVSSVLIITVAVCFMILNEKRSDAALADATLTIWYPVDESTKDNQDVWQDEEKSSDTMVMNDSSLSEAEMLNMLKSYESIYPNIKIEIKGIPEAEYEETLKEAIRTGRDVPEVFDSTCLEPEFQQGLARLSETGSWLDERGETDRYYFMDQYQRYFPDQKQMPLSFQIPVVYSDSLIAGEEITEITDIDQMQKIVDQEDNYAINQELLTAYQKLIPSVKENYGYDEFSLNLTEQDNGNMGTGEFDAEAEKEKLLQGKMGYYLSDTSEYQNIQDDMAGIYKVILMKDIPLQGRFSNLWSVYGKASKAQQKAGVRLIYFLLSKENQEMLTLKNSNGLPLHKEVFDEYEVTNTEFTGLKECLNRLSFNN